MDSPSHCLKRHAAANFRETHQRLPAHASQQRGMPILALSLAVLCTPLLLLRLVFRLITRYLLPVVLIVHCAKQAPQLLQWVSFCQAARAIRPVSMLGKHNNLDASPCQLFWGRMLRPPCPPMLYVYRCTRTAGRVLLPRADRGLQLGRWTRQLHDITSHFQHLQTQCHWCNARNGAHVANFFLISRRSLGDCCEMQVFART